MLRDDLQAGRERQIALAHTPAGPSASFRGWTRPGLIALAVPYSVLGVWLVLAPHSFYRDFPGFGQRWVSPLGAYSQHAFSDFGGALLALSLIVWAAARTLEPSLLRVALLASLVQGTSHFAYHLLHLEPLSTAADIGNQAALSYFILLPAALLILTRRRRLPGPANAPRSEQ